MKYYARCKALNKSLLRMLDDTNVLTEVKIEKKLPHVRLEVNPFVVSEETKRVASVAAAHNLQQYKLRKYTISLRPNVTSWLVELLKVDEKENFRWS